MTSETKKCAHECCTCIPPAGAKYCSTYCKDAKSMITLRCDCGHAACEGCGAMGDRH